MEIIDEDIDRPSVRERIVGFLWRALPYVLFTLFLAVFVGLVCRVAAHVEDRSAADKWNSVIESASWAVKNSEARQ